jgi:hypothetical protein
MNNTKAMGPEFEDTKGVIIFRKPKKERQHNGLEIIFLILWLTPLSAISW